MAVQIIYWEAVLIQGVFTLISLTVALLLWKILPKSNYAFFNGRQWKFGGAFAGFVLTWGLIHYFSLETYAELKPDSDLYAEILEPPINKSKYGKLFEGFDRDSAFYAYNAPFEVEKKKIWNDALEVHSDRYVNLEIQSKYLFYEKSSFNNAVTFFKDLREKIGADVFDKYVEIRYYENAPVLPCNSFFMMTKGGRDRLVFYPHPNRIGQVPSMVLRVTGAESLFKYYHQFFELNWNEAEPVEVWGQL